MLYALSACRRLKLPLDGEGDVVVQDLVPDHASFGDYAELPCISPLAERDPDYQFFYAGTVSRPSPCINEVRAAMAAHLM